MIQQLIDFRFDQSQIKYWFDYFKILNKFNWDSNYSPELVISDSNWEVKGKNYNQMLRRYLEVINHQKDRKSSKLTCSDIEYYNENALMINLKDIVFQIVTNVFIQNNKKLNQNQFEHFVDDIINSGNV